MSRALDIPKDAQTWPSSVFSLVTGAFLLPFGRLADIYGAYVVFNAGLLWFSAWALISGFSVNYQMLIAARALGGLGSAAFLPTSIMLLGKTYRPGPRKNLVFGLYSAFAPIGFFIGIIVGGVTTQLLSWRFYFWLGSIVPFVLCVASFVTIPRDWASTRRENAHVRMDYWGVVTIVPGLALTTFAITYGGHAPDGWRTPYIIVTFVLGVLLLAAAVYVEGWVAKQPLLPFDLFQPKYMGRMTVAMFFAYGVFGVFLFYASFQYVAPSSPPPSPPPPPPPYPARAAAWLTYHPVSALATTWAALPCRRPSGFHPWLSAASLLPPSAASPCTCFPAGFSSSYRVSAALHAVFSSPWRPRTPFTGPSYSRL